MVRERLKERGVGASEFRWRGNEITRIEGFTDAVFAFAVTLLVVSLEVPETFDELLAAMRGFFAFAICFWVLLTIWYNHYIFFRRYGLQDLPTTILNGILLFVVLFYVYPLKFLFTLFIGQIFGQEGVQDMIRPEQVPTLFVIYGLGFLAISLVSAALYFYAYRKRHELGLNPLEQFDTTANIQTSLVRGGVALLSVLIALIVGTRGASLAGWAYFLLAPALTIDGMLSGRRRRELEVHRVAAKPSPRS